jgi:hypothetical protein
MKAHPDLNDTLRDKGEAAVRERSDKAKQFNGRSKLVHDVETKHRIKITPFGDIEQALQKEHLIQDFLGARELSCLFGEPGTAKSVFAGDLAAHVGWGQQPWFGRRVTRCGVLYVAAERAALIKRRLAAFRIHHGVTDIPLAVLSGSFDLRSNRTSADAIVDIAKQWSDATCIKTGLIIGDTTSRLLAGGDENSPKDMGAFINNVAFIQEKTEAHIMLVHHVPHDANRMRGHSLQLAAMDTTILVQKNESGIRTATVDKNNDGDEGAQLAFDLLGVEIGCDPETGAATTAPVIRARDEKLFNAPPEPKLSKNQKTMFSILRDAGPSGLTTQEWDTRARAEGIGVPRRADLYDTRTALKAKRIVRQYGDRWTVSTDF